MSESEAKLDFKDAIDERIEIKVTFWSWLLYSQILPYLCCLKKCCARSSAFKKKIDRYAKFEAGLERLAHEQDIQYLIGMNRISRLVHKANFLKR